MEQSQIRNFVIISHIDHGKSTLADRFLEITGTIKPEKMRPQYLDMMDLEREKGITIKMQPVRMEYFFQGKPYFLNLIDTPGHVDFSYEVSRSLAAVEGAILLVDASKGIQAQTIGNLELAKKQNLVIIPVINKIDLIQAKIEETKKEIAAFLAIQPEEVIEISAKLGENVERVLEAIIKKIPPPYLSKEGEKEKLRALIFDSQYNPYQGTLAFLRIFEGEIKKGDPLYLLRSKSRGEAKEVGVFKPELKPVEKLGPGEIGFVATGIKETGRLRVGDTLTKWQSSISRIEIEPLAGYQEPQPMVFLSIYPENSSDFEILKSGLERLKLNDAALNFGSERKEGLGRGFQLGFLGLLHAEITIERLKREFNLNLILSQPSVIYKVITTQNKEILIRTASDWPETEKIKFSEELWTKVRILAPFNYLGPIIEFLESFQSSRRRKIDYLGREKIELIYEMPLREIIAKNFYDKLKSLSQGFASMNYEILGWRKADLVKLDILILGRKEEALSKIIPREKVFQEGRKIVEKLKETLPPQLFSLPIQAAMGGKIIARETIKARGRDVLAPLYGGDYSRKKKLLEQQKRGKKELKEKGKVRIPSKVFLEIFKI